MSIEVLWLFISFVLTLLIFSYIFGDNPLFRLATYAFVGVSAGYLLVTILQQVLWPKLAAPLLKIAVPVTLYSPVMEVVGAAKVTVPATLRWPARVLAPVMVTLPLRTCTVPAPEEATEPTVRLPPVSS